MRFYIPRNIARQSKVLGLGLLEWYVILVIVSLGVAIPALLKNEIPIKLLLIISLILYVGFRLTLKDKESSYYLDKVQFYSKKKGVFFSDYSRID